MGSEFIVPTLIVFIFIAACIAFGAVSMFQSKRAGTYGGSEDFFTGEASVSPWMASMTYIATVFSAFIFMGSVGGYYNLGMGYNIFLLSELATAGIFIPTFGRKLYEMANKHHFVTPSDFVAYRFGNNKIVRVGYGVLMVLFTVAFMAAQIVAIAYILEIITGGFFSYTVAVLTVGGVLIAYILLGGYKAVVYTDCLQAIMLIATVVVTFIVVLMKFDLPATYLAMDSLRQINFAPGPIGAYTPLFYVTQFLVVGISFVLMPQLWVRLHAMRSKRGLIEITKNFTFWTSFIFMAAAVFAVCIGYKYNVVNGTVVANVAADKLTLTYMFDEVPKWIAATLLSGCVAASMSTVNSQILAVSSILTRDFYTQLTPEKKHNEAFIGRIWIIILCAISAIYAFWPPQLFVNVLISGVYPGMAAGVPAIIIAFLWKGANVKGAIASLIVGFITAFYTVYAGVHPFGIYNAFFTFICALIALVVVSLITRSPEDAKMLPPEVGHLMETQ